MTHEPPLPPPSLRFMGEDDDTYRRWGDQLVHDLWELAGLGFTSDVLDLGCGYGRLAHALMRDWRFRGSYLGIDILERHLAWCHEHLARDSRWPLTPSFAFRCVDIRNDRYNPDGAVPATEVVFDMADGSLDLVTATSLFTHMWGEEVRHYLGEIARLLAPGGRSYVTAFLLNDDQRRLADAGNEVAQFPARHGEHARSRFPDEPLRQIAFEEDWLRAEVTDAGMDVETVVPGYWCGRDFVEVSAARYQDVLVLSSPHR